MYSSIDTKQIYAVFNALKDNEDILSDGYKYYCRSEKAMEFYDDSVDKALARVAIDIIEKLNKAIYKGT
jgi:hypothetical protein